MSRGKWPHRGWSPDLDKIPPLEAQQMATLGHRGAGRKRTITERVQMSAVKRGGVKVTLPKLKFMED